MAFTPEPDRVYRPAERQEPYGRATFPDGSTRDGKVTAWEGDMVLFNWPERHPGDRHQLWMPASRVRRIPRRESSWQDAYDDHAFFEANGEL
ncbi:hypothetical protein GCM10023259_103390 [Thermocatellispora tengchongensis]|uniref:Uncharacterized protein n=1 Tax=Arthrobacter ginkgonis TaxID=1630594 RepID=A0ABP7DJ34_9MICC